MQGEENVRYERGSRQVPHLPRAGVQHQHRGQRQRNQADLITEKGHALSQEQAAELRVSTKNRSDHRRQSAEDPRRALVEPTVMGSPVFTANAGLVDGERVFVSRFR
jgi:hypothetical protein